MGPRRTRRFAVLAACAGLVALGVAASDAAIVRHGDVELRAEGDFTPHELPRNHPAPIEIDGRASLHTVDGGPLPRLEQLLLDFDRDGRLTTRGLATCAPASIEGVGIAAARRKCEKAIVGRGTVGAVVQIEGRWVRVNGTLTLFNGPPGSGVASVVAHAQPVSLPDEIYVVTIPIERTKGDYGYRATIEVPEIFNGTGVLTKAQATIGRRYRHGGRELSYTSARCSDSTLAVHGRFTFADGMVIDGSIEKFCLPTG